MEKEGLTVKKKDKKQGPFLPFYHTPCPTQELLYSPATC